MHPPHKDKGHGAVQGFSLATKLVIFAAVLALAPAAALAQVGDIFEIRKDTAKLPPIEEYNDIPEGVVLTKEAAPDDSGAKKEEAEGVVFNAAKMTYEEAVRLYREGKYEEAKPTLLFLAEGEHPGALELLGVMHRQGQGVTPDDTIAFEMLQRAAEQKRPLAQHHLGVMYFLGHGTKQDKTEALKWLSLSLIYYPDSPEKTRAREDRDAVFADVNRREKDIAADLVQKWLGERGDSHLLDMR